MRRSHCIASLSTFVGAVFALAVAACSTGEGERCNPNRYTDECASGLACTTPDNCVESYCCPASGKSGDPHCNACPATSDAPSNDAEDAEGESSTDAPADSGDDAESDAAVD